MKHHPRRFARLLAAGPITALLAVGLSLVPATQVQAQTVVHTLAQELSGPLNGIERRVLPFPAGHVALHWDGNPDANVTIAFSTDGTHFGAPVDAERDEVGEQRQDGRTYGAILSAGGATAVEIGSDRPLGKLTVLGLADGATTVTRTQVPGPIAGAATAPGVVSRAGWGADETLRFNRRAQLVWPPVFQTAQKLVVHHTAGANGEMGAPARATIRAIYYYHAVTEGWGDIGYNFLVDAAGTIYKGRSTSQFLLDNGDTSGENSLAQGVTAGHAYGYNSGTVGVALLGTFTTVDATPAAKDGLAAFLAWKAGAHGLDALGSSLYTNPVNGTQIGFPNVPGHQQVPNNTTECPGGVFLANSLTTIRQTAFASAGTPDSTAPSAPKGLKAATSRSGVTLNWWTSTDQGTGTGGTSGVAGYDVYRTSGTGSPVRLGSTTAITYLDSSTIRGTSYQYSVTAYDGAGNRGAASLVSITT